MGRDRIAKPYLPVRETNRSTPGFLPGYAKYGLIPLLAGLFFMFLNALLQGAGPQEGKHRDSVCEAYYACEAKRETDAEKFECLRGSKHYFNDNGDWFLDQLKKAKTKIDSPPDDDKAEKQCGWIEETVCDRIKTYEGALSQNNLKTLNLSRYDLVQTSPDAATENGKEKCKKGGQKVDTNGKNKKKDESPESTYTLYDDLQRFRDFQIFGIPQETRCDKNSSKANSDKNTAEKKPSIGGFITECKKGCKEKEGRSSPSQYVQECFKGQTFGALVGKYDANVEEYSHLKFKEIQNECDTVISRIQIDPTIATIWEKLRQLPAMLSLILLCAAAIYLLAFLFDHSIGKALGSELRGTIEKTIKDLLSYQGSPKPTLLQNSSGIAMTLAITVTIGISIQQTVEIKQTVDNKQSQLEQRQHKTDLMLLMYNRMEGQSESEQKRNTKSILCRCNQLEKDKLNEEDCKKLGISPGEGLTQAEENSEDYKATCTLDTATLKDLYKHRKSIFIDLKKYAGDDPESEKIVLTELARVNQRIDGILNKYNIVDSGVRTAGGNIEELKRLNDIIDAITAQNSQLGDFMIQNTATAQNQVAVMSKWINENQKHEGEKLKAMNEGNANIVNGFDNVVKETNKITRYELDQMVEDRVGFWSLGWFKSLDKKYENVYCEAKKNSDTGMSDLLKKAGYTGKGVECKD